MSLTTIPKTNTGTNAQIDATLGAPSADRRWYIDALSASVSAGAALFTLIEDVAGALTPPGPFVVWQVEVVAGQPLHLPFPIPLTAVHPGASVTARLGAAGATNVGVVNILGHLL